MKRRFLSYVVAVPLLCGMYACTEDINFNEVSTDIKHNISLVVPLGVAEATIEQVIDNLKGGELLKDEQNNTCYLHFEDSMVIHDTISRFNHGASMSDQYLVQNDPQCPKPLGQKVTQGTQFTLTQNLNYNFDYDEYIAVTQVLQRVDRMIVSRATVYINFNFENLALGGSQVTAVISFPDITELQGQSWSITLPDGGANFSQEINTPFTVNFSEGGNFTKMKIEYTFVAGNNLYLYSNSTIKQPRIKVDFIDFQKAWGYFGKPDEFTHDDKVVPVPTGIFNRPVFERNNLLFHNPQISFNFKSNVGVPLNFEVEEIKAVDANGVEKYADFNGNRNYVMPLDEAPTEGGFSSNSFLFDRENGGTHQLFQIKPERFLYKFNVKVRKKDGVTSHFWFRPTNVNVKFSIKLPFVFDPGSQFAYTDTIPADLVQILGDTTFTSQAVINLVKIKFANTNSLPCQALASAYLLDDSDNVLYQREDISINAGETDANGLVIKPTVSKFSLDFTGNQLHTILGTKKVVVVFYLQAEDHPNSPLNFRLTDALTSQVSVFAQGGIDTSK